MKKIFYLTLFCTVCQSPAQSQKKPGLTPERLVLDFHSSEPYAEMSAVFHPNGKEFYFTSFDEQGTPGIMVSHLKKGKWLSPSPLLDGDGMVPVITKDGQKLYYSSIELTNETDTRKEPNIWVMEREGEKWSIPKPLGPEVNSPDSGEWFPSTTDDGTLYFKRSNFKKGTESIYFSETENEQHKKAVFLKAAFNIAFNTEDPFVAPDKRYLIFSPGGPDLYGPMHIAFQDKEGSWSSPKNMGLDGTMPSLSADRKYLFFIKNDDVYWVDVQIVESFR